MAEGGGIDGTLTAPDWSDSIEQRLRAARVMSKCELAVVHERLREGCPVEPWPYGCATSINPLLVTLGPSPGNSPDPTVPDPAGKPLAPPTAGERHPHTKYNDRKGVWRKIRFLARTVLSGGNTDEEEDVYALLGNMSLDTRRAGSATDVPIRLGFGRWVLRTIRDGLRPRYLICIGLKGHEQARNLLEETFDGYERRRPHAEYRFRGYGRVCLTFQEWDCTGPEGNAIKIVHWPQHPSKPPFGSLETWKDACREFADRHRDLVHP